MKHGNLVIALLVIAAFAGGYTSPGEESAAKMQKETKGAVEAVKDYTFAQKTEFVAKMKSELAKINTQIDKLSKKVENAGDAAKAEAKSKLQALRDQAAELNKQLDEANNVAESNWTDFQAGVKKSYSDIKGALYQSRRWLSKQIAP